jgi:UDP-N-acetylmuramoyl-L-alanyl-D-glutamate--2,6-diaminopimelate ligase
MMLHTLIANVSVVRLDGTDQRPVSTVTRDSRDVRPNDVFVAIRGANVDGHDLVGSLTAAAAVVVERDVVAPPGVTVVVVPDTRKAFALLAAAQYGYPSRNVKVIGVTGTNGKTTTTTLVDEALRHLAIGSGRIGTTGVVLDGTPVPSSLTTPEAPALQRTLARARDLGLLSISMEVSSIGLDQHRVDGIDFHTAVFTNLSRDHLDYHGTMEKYAACKARLFTDLLREPGGWPRALAFEGDAGRSAIQLPRDCWTYGTKTADVRLTHSQTTGEGTALSVETPLGPVSWTSQMVGHHNAQNMVAALGCLLTLDVPIERAGWALSQVGGVAGRFETVSNPHGALLLVDYAHSPDALASALHAARHLCTGRLFVVFGCGGDRDRGKRPQMGTVADELADVVVVTSDNPRSESPLQIVDDILVGVAKPAHADVDRAAAIAWTVAQSTPGDVVLVAGKGHETTQEIAGQFHDFDDRVALRRALEMR